MNSKAIQVINHIFCFLNLLSVQRSYDCPKILFVRKLQLYRRFSQCYIAKKKNNLPPTVLGHVLIIFYYRSHHDYFKKKRIAIDGTTNCYNACY